MPRDLENMASEEILKTITPPCDTNYTNKGIQILAKRGYKEAIPMIQQHLDWAIRYLNFYARPDRPGDKDLIFKTKAICEDALKLLKIQ